jgi:biopolymer transport protein ExbD
MRGRGVKPPEGAEIDLTPMLDVVFILLIFFIVTSTFAREEAIGLEPPPPPSPPDQQEQQQVPAILIYVDESNLITINGRLADVSSVRANIERVIAETPNSSVIIQADPKAKSGVIVKIRDEAYNAGFQDRVNIVISES